MAPKKVTTRASSSLDEATKAALANKKGKAALADNTLPAAAENNEAEAVNSKHLWTEDPPTPKGSIHTCSSKNLPCDDPSPGFAPMGSHLVQEDRDNLQDGKDLGISAEDQLKLRSLRIKTGHLQRQREVLAAKRQRTNMQVRIRQLIMEEEEKAKELEQEIAEMQHEDPLHQQPAGAAYNQNFYCLPRPAPMQVAFQGLNYLDECSPLSSQL